MSGGAVSLSCRQCFGRTLRKRCAPMLPMRRASSSTDQRPQHCRLHRPVVATMSMNRIKVHKAVRFTTSTNSSKSGQKAASSANSNNSKPPPPSLLRTWWENGSILLAIGWTGLAIVAVDRFLQYQNQQDAAGMVDFLVVETRRKQQALLEQHASTPSLFHARVAKVYRMGGSHGLAGVQENDIVEVLQEGVGPGKYYNLCRLVRKKQIENNQEEEEEEEEISIGWYPISYMQKISPPAATKKKGWFG